MLLLRNEKKPFPPKYRTEQPRNKYEQKHIRVFDIKCIYCLHHSVISNAQILMSFSCSLLTSNPTFFRWKYCHLGQAYFGRKLLPHMDVDCCSTLKPLSLAVNREQNYVQIKKKNNNFRVRICLMWDTEQQPWTERKI